jgi:hypothetical protein
LVHHRDTKGTKIPQRNILFVFVLCASVVKIMSGADSKKAVQLCPELSILHHVHIPPNFFSILYDEDGGESDFRLVFLEIAQQFFWRKAEAHFGPVARFFGFEDILPAAGTARIKRGAENIGARVVGLHDHAVEISA